LRYEREGGVCNPYLAWTSTPRHAFKSTLVDGFFALVRRQIGNETGVHRCGCTLLRGPESKSSIENRWIGFQSKKQEAMHQKVNAEMASRPPCMQQTKNKKQSAKNKT